MSEAESSVASNPSSKSRRYSDDFKLSAVRLAIEELYN